MMDGGVGLINPPTHSARVMRSENKDTIPRAGESRYPTVEEDYDRAYDQPLDQNAFIYATNASMDDHYANTPRNMQSYENGLWGNVGYTTQPQDLSRGPGVFFEGVEYFTAGPSNPLPSPESSNDTYVGPRAVIPQVHQQISAYSSPPEDVSIASRPQKQRKAKESKRRKINKHEGHQVSQNRSGFSSESVPETCQTISNVSANAISSKSIPSPNLDLPSPPETVRHTKSTRRTYKKKPPQPTETSMEGCDLPRSDIVSQRERNRVAASKCRAKSKRNIEELEESNRLVTEQRQFLSAWAASLKDELITLKAEVLRHGDCDCELIQSYIKNMAQKVGQSGERVATASP